MRLSYFPVMSYQRIRSISSNIRAPSINGLILVPPACPQRTGTSSTRKPNFRARKRISGSNPQRSMRCNGNIVCAARRVKALKPHCVSLNCNPKISRFKPLKILPKSWRCSDWRCVCNSERSQREPMAISAPPPNLATVSAFLRWGKISPRH